MKSLETMTPDERSLLLFFECRTVDHGGLVDTRHMNSEDMALAKKWAEDGFVKFGRVVYRDHETRKNFNAEREIVSSRSTHWVTLSPEAWELAHAERKARHGRLWLKKDWLTTEDNREAYGDPHLSGLNGP